MKDKREEIQFEFAQELKNFLVVDDYEDDFLIWTKEKYEEYVAQALSFGATSAVKVITHFNKEDSLFQPKREEPIEDKALEELAEKLCKANWFEGNKFHFIAGYKANQSDVVEFANWLGQYYGYDGKVWINLCDIKAEEKLTAEELYQIFKNKTNGSI